MNFREIPWHKVKECYNEKDVEVNHIPIKNFSERDLKANLFKAATKLNEMINERGQKVYVHCTAGVGRGPSVVLAYLFLFKKADIDCDDINAVSEYIKKYRGQTVPN